MTEKKFNYYIKYMESFNKTYMLPTEDKTNVVKYAEGYLMYHYTPHGVPKCDESQYLYVASDGGELKKGDWFINTGSGGHPFVAVYQANSENSKAINEFKFPEIKKIIASTDPKLIKTGISKLDEDAMKEFIGEYNKVKGF